MTTFCANISTLFTEAPLIERFKLARKAGFKYVEIQFPYELSKESIAQALHDNQLKLHLINLPKGDNQELGIACDPSRQAEFKRSLALCLDYARYLHVTNINCLSGIPPKHISLTAARNTLIENLRHAADILLPLDITLLIEAINTLDIPGFYLHGSQQGIDIIHDVKRSNVKFQYDVYHMQIMEGNLTARINKILPYIGHIQIADVPGRGEPGTGEINYPNLLNAINLMGYTEVISLEYFPRQSTLSGLTSLEPLLQLKGDET